MRSSLIAVMVLLGGWAHAQNNKGRVDSPLPAAASAPLHNHLQKDPSNPLWYYLLAQQKLQAGDYDSCILYCNRSMELLASRPNDTLLAKALHAKGNAQYYLDDKEKAESNWRLALQSARRVKDMDRVIKLSSNLGAVYLDEFYTTKKDIHSFAIADSFLAIAYNALEAADSLYTPQGLLTLRLMATSLHFQKKYEQADIYYKKVIALAKQMDSKAYLGALTFYAEALSETGKHQQAIACTEEALQHTGTSNTSSKDRVHILYTHAAVLSKSGNYKEGYRYLDSAAKLAAADYEKVNAEAYAASESKFKNRLLQYDIELERQKKTKLYYLIAGIVGCMFIIMLWLYNLHGKRLAKEKVRQKQIAIDAFIEGEEKEKARIGRELHDGIAQEIVAVKLALQPQENAGIIRELNRISHDIRNISHELMPQTLREFGLAMALEDICHKILAASGIQYELDVNLPAERLENKIEITLYRIFQELVHNIIKHSGASEVMIQLRHMQHQVVLVVEDNGKGMGANNKMGIGINNLKSRVQLVDGYIQYDSNKEEGTTAIVRVPLA